MFKVDNEIIKELKKGNKDAFDYIFNSYSNKIYYMSMKYTRNESDSDDCVQDIFMKMLNKIDEFDPKKSNFGTWIYALTTNYLIDRLRMKKIHQEAVIIQNDIVDLAKEEGIGMLLAKLSQIEKVIGAKNYNILVMKIGFKMTFTQISRELNISKTTLKRIFHDSLVKIKEFENRRIPYE